MSELTQLTDHVAQVKADRKYRAFAWIALGLALAVAGVVGPSIVGTGRIPFLQP